MLAALDPSVPSHCRARAILTLAAVYGMRRAELIALSLDDVDLARRVLTVRRAKRGRVQQFPLSTEATKALSAYIQNIRRPSVHRNIFLTLQAPHRPAINLGSAMRQVMTATQAFDREWGLHSLRHACATELLRQGTSLRGIADYLGHRGLESVSTYAHCDRRALQMVADVDLRGIL